MKISATSNLSSLNKLLSNMKKKIDYEVDKSISDMSIYASKSIVHQTKIGIDVNNRSFKKYSPVTVRLKGRNNVNLIETGKMLASVSSKKTGKFRYKTYLKGSENNRKASLHMNGETGMPARKFFGINNKTKKYIKNRARTAAKRIIK